MSNEYRCNILIIGGGASGMAAGIFAARNGASDIIIIERNEGCGKKLTATGNGKCNYTNTNAEISNYRTGNTKAAAGILKAFSYIDTIKFFKSIGILTKIHNGYCYPMSEQAASVKRALETELKRLGIKVVNNCLIRRISKNKETFSLEAYKALNNNTYTFNAKKVIMATGGCSSPCFGSDGNGYKLLNGLKHSIKKPLPALVQLCTVNSKNLKTISGVRLEARLELYNGKEMITNEAGELLFTQYGISGIPVMQISRYASYLLDNGICPDICIDLLPSLTYRELEEYVYERICCPGINIEEALNGLLNNKLIFYLLIKNNIKPELKANCDEVKSKAKNIIKDIKRFTLTINATNGFENSQVTSGGVPLEEIDNATMESQYNKGLYITGELLDVDGSCGGYNLQWAWSTAALAGKAASEGMGEKN